MTKRQIYLLAEGTTFIILLAVWYMTSGFNLTVMCLLGFATIFCLWAVHLMVWWQDSARDRYKVAELPNEHEGVAAVGDQGVSATPLHPVGKVRFGPHIVTAMTAGELLGEGVAVEVIERRRNKVLVRAAVPIQE